MRGVADDNLVRRAYWFIRIRWIAAATVVLVTFVASRVFSIPIEAGALYAIAVLLAAYNLAFLIHLRRLGSGHRPLPTETVYRTAALQISLDLLSLGALIHFSGGVENPFLFYFIFHMIIASILLSRRAAFLQACLAVSVFTGVAVLEYAGVLPHYCLDGFVGGTQHDNPLFVAGTSFVLASTVFAAVYMASSVASALREREAALAETNKLLVEHDCIKSEYVHRVTHDIKGHLAAIRSCLDPVADGVVGSLTAEQRNLTERARRRTDTLLTFVKALLELTRMRLCKTIAMDEFPVAGAVETAVSYVETKAAARSITVERDVGAAAGTIRGARIYIEETLGNILANAVKYSPAGGKVWIRVAGETDVVLVEIGDRGIGIPAEELPRVFDEFYRAANARAIERDGTGLGLSMAKQVVSRHGGEIWVESTEGVGTTVKLTLPRDPPAGRESPPA
jgi:signal transduction histidine kinase